MVLNLWGNENGYHLDEENFDVQKSVGDALCDLVQFVQFTKRKKYPRRSVTFRKVSVLSQMYRKKDPSLKLNLYHSNRFRPSELQTYLILKECPD